MAKALMKTVPHIWAAWQRKLARKPGQNSWRYCQDSNQEPPEYIIVWGNLLISMKEGEWLR